MKFLGMGVPELLIILAVVLLIFGPRNLPKLGASLGKTVKSLRDGMSTRTDSDEDEDDESVMEIEEADEEPAPVKKTVRKKAVKAAQSA